MIMPRIPGQVALDYIDDIMGANQDEKGNTWVMQDTDVHLAHATEHLFKYNQEGDMEEDHLAHAITRIAMALAIRDGKV